MQCQHCAFIKSVLCNSYLPFLVTVLVYCKQMKCDCCLSLVDNKALTYWTWKVKNATGFKGGRDVVQYHGGPVSFRHLYSYFPLEVKTIQQGLIRLNCEPPPPPPNHHEL